MTPQGVEYPDPFRYWADRWIERPEIRCLAPDESLLIGDVEYGLHGDRGPNGSRGSARSLRRIGVKTVIGHSHSPAIEEGCYQTGTSTRLRLEYNAGPSSWLQSHVCQYASGRRVLLNIIEGEWRI
jgi:hypothetical protein